MEWLLYLTCLLTGLAGGSWLYFIVTSIGFRGVASATVALISRFVRRTHLRTPSETASSSLDSLTADVKTERDVNENATPRDRL